MTLNFEDNRSHFLPVQKIEQLKTETHLKHPLPPPCLAGIRKKKKKKKKSVNVQIPAENLAPLVCNQPSASVGVLKIFQPSRKLFMHCGGQKNMTMALNRNVTDSGT